MWLPCLLLLSALLSASGREAPPFSFSKSAGLVGVCNWEFDAAERDTAAELDICEDLGTEAGSFAFIGPCSVLKLVCPPPSAMVTGTDEATDASPPQPPSGDALGSACGVKEHAMNLAKRELQSRSSRNSMATI